MIGEALSGLVRVGTVTDVNSQRKQARVKFQGEEMTSGWLYVLQHYGATLRIAEDGSHTHSISDTYSGGGHASTVADHDHAGSVLSYYMPRINDTVVCLYLPVFNGDGFIIGGIA